MILNLTFATLKDYIYCILIVTFGCYGDTLTVSSCTTGKFGL